MKPTMVFINAETQEQIIRELNDEEYAQYLIDVEDGKALIAQQKADNAEFDAKESAKAEARKQALAALGLSQEVVNLLAE